MTAHLHTPQAHARRLMISRRRMLQIIAAGSTIGLASFLAACKSEPASPTATAPGADTGSTQPATGPTAAANQPTSAPTSPPATTPASSTKTITIGVSAEPDAIANWPGGMAVTQLVQNLLFNVLVSIDDQMKAYPDLAEAIPTLENGGAKWIGEGENRQLEVTFTLRRGVTWSDGQLLTAKDIVFTWELMLNPKSGAAPDLELKYEKVVAKDDHTVVFTFFSEKSARAMAAQAPDYYGDWREQSGPIVDPLYIFGIAGSWIYPEHILGPLVDNQPRTSPKVQDLLTGSDYARKPVGTGPYTLKDWTAGTALTLTARDDYFRGAPKIGTVVFSIVPKPDTLIAKLKAGEVDVITQDALDVSHSPVLDKLENATPYYTVGTSWEHIDLNVSDPILQDKNVRHALYHGIDRKELVEKVFLGLTQPVHSVILDWSWAYNKDVPIYDYNPARAGELLDQAGWKLGSDGIREQNGQKLKLKLITTDAPIRMKGAPLIKDQLKQIGVDLEIEHMASKPFFDRTSGPLAQRTFQLCQFQWNGSFDPGADSTYAFHSRNIPSKENNFAGGNYAGYSNPEVDQALERGFASLDQNERAKEYQHFQKLIMEDLPVLPLYVRPNTCAATKRLVNFKPGKSNVGETWNIHEWDLT